MKTEDTEVLGRELNQSRSKPDTVDRPVRTAHIFVHHYNRQRQFYLYSPSSRPTSHLRCAQVEVRAAFDEETDTKTSKLTVQKNNIC